MRKVRLRDVRELMAPNIQKPHQYQQKNNHNRSRRIKASTPTAHRFTLTIKRRALPQKMESVQERYSDNHADDKAQRSSTYTKCRLVVGGFEELVKLLHGIIID